MLYKLLVIDLAVNWIYLYYLPQISYELWYMNYIILGLLTQFKVKDCVEFSTYAYWPTVICAGITQFVLQTWAYNVLFGSVYYVEYYNKSCEKTPFISAIVILIIDTVYSFIVFIKMIYKMCKWCGSYGISKYSSSFLRRPQKFDDISHLIWCLLSKIQINCIVFNAFVEV